MSSSFKVSQLSWGPRWKKYPASVQKVIFLFQTRPCPFIILPQHVYISFRLAGDDFGTTLVYCDTFKDPSNTVKGLSCIIQSVEVVLQTVQSAGRRCCKALPTLACFDSERRATPRWGSCGFLWSSVIACTTIQHVSCHKRIQNKCVLALTCSYILNNYHNFKFSSEGKPIKY